MQPNSNANHDLEKIFPSLQTEEYALTSPCDTRYNCIAWAAGDVHRWWWPDIAQQAYWPEDVERRETVGAFIEAYKTLGYTTCPFGDFEEGFEKVAIYVSENNVPKHAARQLGKNKWTSKVGKLQDISHTLRGLRGQEYGEPKFFLKRKAWINVNRKT